MKRSFLKTFFAWLALFFAVASVGETAIAGPTDQTDSNASQIDRGRYLITVAGCNDCHTPEYGPSNGQVPEEKWLIGDAVGWKGPWGTTYPINLRRFVAALSEDQWLSVVKTAEARPPMPWIALHRMEDNDLRAIYAYIKTLQPVGPEAPAYLPPDQVPSTPYFTMVLPEPAK